MKVLFETSFLKALKKIQDSKLQSKIESAILNVESAKDMSAISSLKKIKGCKDYYRIKLDKSFRIGIKLFGDTIIFITVMNRKDIYKYFP